MGKMLVATAELAGHLDDPKWVVFDARHDLTDHGKGLRAYGAGHIPGAYFLDMESDLAGVKTGKNGRHPLPDIATFAKKINAAGVGPDSQVVVYDDLAATSRCGCGGC